MKRHAVKFKITVKPNARKNEVTRTADGTLVIRVAVPPIEGKANEKVIEVLSEYLNKPKRSISIISGFKGKNKIIEVE
jgi:uncharacterized protein (TIGR00251 family)